MKYKAGKKVTTAQYTAATKKITTAKEALVKVSSEKAALKVKSLVEDLTEVSSITSVHEARQAYDKLTKEQQNLVAKETVEKLASIETAAKAIAITEKEAAINEAGALGVYFTFDKEIDLAKGASNVKLAYYTLVNGDKVAMTNSIADNTPLVKSKTWDGYLASTVQNGLNFSKGLLNSAKYSNVIPANHPVGSIVKNGYHANGDMDYVSVTNFNDEPATYIVEITVINAAGVTTEKTVSYEVKAN